MKQPTDLSVMYLNVAGAQSADRNCAQCEGRDDARGIHVEQVVVVIWQNNQSVTERQGRKEDAGHKRRLDGVQH